MMCRLNLSVQRRKEPLTELSDFREIRRFDKVLTAINKSRLPLRNFKQTIFRVEKLSGDSSIC